MPGWNRATKWVDSRVFAVDALVALLFCLAVTPFDNSLAGEPTSAWWAVLLSIPLAWRRTRPVASAVAVYSVAFMHMLAGIPLAVPSDFAVVLALYSITVHGPRWATRVAPAATAVGCLVLGLLIGSPSEVGTAFTAVVFTGAIGLAAWALGLLRRSRVGVIEALREKAQRLEVERNQQVRLAIQAERARIAREMHDIIAHSLTVMVAQADGGRYASAADPAAGERALGTIAETGRAALADMRRLLGVLRTEESDDDRHASGGSTPATQLAPQPDSGDIESLVEQVRASGLRVSLVRMGAARVLPPGAGLTVYRICQEALTNVLKHAGPDPAVTILMQWSTALLSIEISDDGRGAAADSDGAGQGLLGMRERAAMFGGTVTAGPRPGGGFRVRVQLPLPSGAVPSGAGGGR